ncbi:MAG: dTDP-4-dehydrorhamnose reductase [Ginsengibacter sp.]
MLSENSQVSILVTGANGQLANELKVIATDYFQYHFFFKTKEELPIENANALKYFFEKNQIDYCINCAAFTAVDKAESEEEKAFKVNAEGVKNLADICEIHQTKLVHISTDYVYDGGSNVPLKEDHNTRPLNVYGASKLKGEELALKNNPSSIVIRTSWVYSSFGNNFVKTMLRLFREKTEINVVADQYGSPTYAADLAKVIMKFIEDLQSGMKLSGVYNYCNDGVVSWYEFAVAIKSFVNSDCVIYPIASSSYQTAAKRPSYSVLDTSKIKEVLHVIIPNWKKSLQKCITVLNRERFS